MNNCTNLNIPKILFDSNNSSTVSIIRDNDIYWIIINEKLFLVGYKIQTNSILCKINCKKGLKTASINCLFDSEINFTSLADYSHFFKNTPINFDKLPISSEVLLNIENLFKKSCLDSDFLHPPLIIARENIPKLLSTIYFHKTIVKEIDNEKKNNFWTISFNSEIPRKPNSFLANNQVFKGLMLLFNQRPAWTKTGIKSSLSNPNMSEVKKVLPLISYTFINGPWRNVWIRYDCDPRIDKSFREYQIIEFRNVYSLTSLKRNRKWNAKLSSTASVNDASFDHLRLPTNK